MKKAMKKFLTTPHLFRKTINVVIAKIRKRGDLKRDNLGYFIIKDPKFARFYLLPKIHKRLHNVPGRPVISNSGYYTKNKKNKLKSFIVKIKKVQRTTKFTAEWSKISINFLDFTVFLIEEVTETDLYVKRTDRHQYLQSSLFQSFHCKKDIP